MSNPNDKIAQALVVFIQGIHDPATDQPLYRFVASNLIVNDGNVPESFSSIILDEPLLLQEGNQENAE